MLLYHFLQKTVFICIIICFEIVIIKCDNDESEADWINIPMPEKSYFMGFSPPDDPIKWKIAKQQAKDGAYVIYNEYVSLK